MSDRPVLELFDVIAAYCLSKGLKAPAETAVDKQWFVAVTGPDKLLLGPADWKIDLEPYHWAAWFNGFIAGTGTPFSGEIAAGEAANEDTLIAALKAAMLKEDQEAGA